MPGGLDQHGPGMGPTLLGDAAVLGPPLAGLMDARVQAEIGDELVRALEPRDWPDGS